MYYIEGLYFGKKIRLEFETTNQVECMFMHSGFRDYVDIDQMASSPEAYEAAFKDLINESNRELIMGKPEDAPVIGPQDIPAHKPTDNP